MEIRELLLRVGDKRWGPRLQSWISEFDSSASKRDTTTLEHVARTRRSVAGMGSIGDVVICREAGHQVSDADVDHLNSRLQKLLNLLFLTTANLLGEKL